MTTSDNYERTILATFGTHIIRNTRAYRTQYKTTILMDTVYDRRGTRTQSLQIAIRHTVLYGDVGEYAFACAHA